MPFIEPADYCVCGCGLQEGVQFLSFCIIVHGILALFQCLADIQVQDPTDQLSAPTIFAIWMDHVVASFGLWAGLAGYNGATGRDPKKIAVFFAYYAIWLVSQFGGLIIREMMMCEDLDRIRKHDPDGHNLISCTGSRISYGFTICIGLVLQVYFVYIIWSLWKKVRMGVISFGTMEVELEGVNVAPPLSLLSRQPQGETAEPFLPQGSSDPGASFSRAPLPFQGTPFRMNPPTSDHDVNIRNERLDKEFSKSSSDDDNPRRPLHSVSPSADRKPNNELSEREIID